MGGIKNKLNKLSNKAKTLFNNLTSPTRLGSSVSGTASRRTPASRVFDDTGLRSKPVGLLSITKYASIACFTLALISTIGLNLYRTYSSSNTLSNAEQVNSSNSNNNEPSTLANDSSTCDPTNTNAAACISMSITSHSATGDSDNGNLSLTIPQGGGLVAGRHTVKVVTNSVSGATLDLYTTDSTNLTSTDNQNLTIPSIGSNSNYYFYDGVTSPLSDGYWGVAIPGSAYANQFGNIYNGADVYEQYVTNPGPIRDTGTYAGISPKFAGIIRANQDSQDSDVDTTIEMWSDAGAHIQDIYYGVMIDDPASFPAGDYSTSVVYTATVKLPSRPTITSVSPNTYELGSGEPNAITISATSGLASTYNVWIDLNSNNTYDANEQCTNLNVASDTTLTCNIPTAESITTDTPYTIYVQTQAEQVGKLENAFTYTKPSICRNADPDSDCQVDIDDNMIPVTYDEERQVWIALNERQINSLTGIWYDYGAKKWANAVTVKNPDIYRESKDVDESDILGYWVYIPRYAYKVQRRDAYNPTNQTSANSAVSAKNFDIVFETNSDPVKQPIECNTGDYQTCVKNQYGASALNYPNTTSQDDPSNNQTAWATHPAFTWKYTQAINGFDQTTELNGFWIGKFETTGTRTAPTVKPNQHANIYEYIGEFYSAAKSIGQPDSANKYGGADTDNTTSSLKQNSHNLAVSTSHMLKNSEWGAVAYLSASRYGAGVNKVQINAAMLASGSTDADGDKSQYGATGCGPESNGVKVLYNAGTLNETTIESSTACGSADRAYNGTIGQYASTTNNVYGVYDMSGGTDEYVMGNYSTNLSQTSNGAWGDEVKIPIKPPYVDIYNITSADDCTWSVGGSGCGGHALFETTSWGYTGSGFAESSFSWFGRGGHVRGSSNSGVFARSWASGITIDDSGFRVALLALPLN